MSRIIPGVCLLLSVVALSSGTAWARDCIGLVPAGTSSFWTELEAGARRTAKDLQVELYTRGPAQEGSVEVLGGSPDSVDVIITDIKRENWATGGKLWSEPRD